MIVSPSLSLHAAMKPKHVTRPRFRLNTLRVMTDCLFLLIFAVFGTVIGQLTRLLRFDWTTSLRFLFLSYRAICTESSLRTLFLSYRAICTESSLRTLFLSYRAICTGGVHKTGLSTSFGIVCQHERHPGERTGERYPGQRHPGAVSLGVPCGRHGRSCDHLFGGILWQYRRGDCGAQDQEHAHPHLLLLGKECTWCPLKLCPWVRWIN